MTIHAISDEALRVLWRRARDIMWPPRAPRPPVPPKHVEWVPSKWWREGVYTSLGSEAYPGCRVCGVIRALHTNGPTDGGPSSCPGVGLRPL